MDSLLWIPVASLHIKFTRSDVSCLCPNMQIVALETFYVRFETRSIRLSDSDNLVLCGIKNLCIDWRKGIDPAEWLGLACIGLARLGLASIGLDWLGLAWIRLDWLGLASLGLTWVRLAWNSIGLAWVGLEWIEFAGMGLD